MAVLTKEALIQIGTLPDGRKVEQYRIYRGQTNPAHYIYVIGNDITVNYETGGKGNHVEVQALIGK